VRLVIMARLMTTCPMTGDEVPTGLWTRDLMRSPGEGVHFFRCNSCNRVHEWELRASGAAGGLLEAWAEVRPGAPTP
jgi:hypothetical protein